MKKITKQTFSLFWHHTKNHKTLAILQFVTVTVATSAALTIPIYYKQFFDTLGQVASKTSAILGGELVHILLIILGLNAVAWLGWRTAHFSVIRFQSLIMEELANNNFNYLHGHSFSFFVNRFVGSLVRRTNRLIDAFESIFDRLTFELYPLALRIVIIIIVTFSWKPLIGAIILLWTILYLVFNYFFTIYKLKFDVQAAEIDSETTAYLADTITNSQNVKLFASHQRELKGYQEVTARQRKLRIFTWNLVGYMEAIQGALMFLMEFAVFYVGIKFWQKGTFTIGDFALIQAYLITLFGQLWNFGRMIQRIYQSLANAEEMVEILNKPHEIQDKPQAKKLVINKGQVVFKEVDFSYHKTRRIIKGFNLEIKPGEKVGLVGPSGAGKTTIVGLLFRFFDVSSGKIFIDDQNVADVTQESLRQQLSFVPQDPVLFHRTLMENIRYGDSDASDKEVMAAAKAAHCHEFITSLPDKYETYVGERGIKLSGGERQRVAIARAILKNSPILVLDEATSSLDSEVELMIQDALTKLMENKTAIIIAHRLSTIMKMDRIVVIDEGMIKEMGSHQELLKKKNGLYKKLWGLQAGGFIS